MWFIIGGAVLFTVLLVFILTRSISNADSRQKEWEDSGPLPSIYDESQGRLKAVTPMPAEMNLPALQSQPHPHQFMPQPQPHQPVQQHVHNYNPGHQGHFDSGMSGGSYHHH